MTMTLLTTLDTEQAINIDQIVAREDRESYISLCWKTTLSKFRSRVKR